MVPSFSPTYRRAIKELNKVVNLVWISNTACSLSQNIYVIINLFITNNYLDEMMRKIIFTNYFSEFIYQVAIKFRKTLQKKCFKSDIIFRCSIFSIKGLSFGSKYYTKVLKTVECTSFLGKSS